MKYKLILICITCLLSIGCTHRQSTQSSDPLESFNRSVFDFNYELIDPYIARPTAAVWRDYMPTQARVGISNFMHNLSEPASIVNYFIVGDFYRGFVHFNRFFLNSIFGMMGTIDIAAMANPKLVKQQHYRLGGVLGYYNVPDGMYIVLPVYGSTTPRQVTGTYFEGMYPIINSFTFLMSAGKWILEGIENRAQLLDYEGLLHSSSEPYILIREAYLQRNEFRSKKGESMTPFNENSEIIQNDLDSIDAY